MNFKFIVGGLLIIAAVVYLIVSSTQASAQYFLTVDELVAKGDSVKDRELRHLRCSDRRFDPIRSADLDPDLHDCRHSRRQQRDRSSGRSGRSSCTRR